MEAPLSLYLDLEGNRDADLEVVSRAALAWAEVVREVAFQVDPSAAVELKLHSGTAGSLSLNSVVRLVRSHAPDDKTLKTIVTSAIVFIFVETGAWSVGKALDHLLSPDAEGVTEGLSEDEVEAIARKAIEDYGPKVAREAVEHLYAELKRDDAIKGVGVTTRPATRPANIVPRDEFEARSTGREVVEEEGLRRTVTDRMKVVLVRPVLVNATDRRWRFRSFTGDFSATIKDQSFLDDVLSGDAKIPLMEGVVLDALIEMTEEREGQLWRPMSYSILHVYKHDVPPYQEPLGFMLDAEQGETADDDESGND